MAFQSLRMAGLAALSLLSIVNAAPVEVLEERQSATSGKRGLPFNSESLANMFSSSSEVTWAYNWNYISNGLSSHFEYIPLLYSDPTGNQEYIDGWQGNVSAGINSGAIKHLLAFNEPDLTSLTPAQAATSYQNFMQPFAGPNVKLGAPAVTNGGAPDGITWLGEFLGNCTGCTVDFIPFHWYCQYDDISYFTAYVQQANAAAGGRPIWFTEFQAVNEYCANTATDQQQAEFMQTVLPWLDSLDYVERYAYFGAFQSSDPNYYLINTDGNGLSAGGQVYATLSNINSTTPTSLVD